MRKRRGPRWCASIAKLFCSPARARPPSPRPEDYPYRLQEVSQLLGISFPVYVLFTKIDRISFFADFVRGMSKDEVSEVLGVTLPLRSLSAGVYADEETRRLTKAFDEFFYSLAERRIVLLPRENEGEQAARDLRVPPGTAQAAHAAGAVSGEIWRGPAIWAPILFCAAFISPEYGPW